MLFGRTPKLKVVRGASFSVDAGETLGLVGESGSGKSTIGRALLGLNRPEAGSIRLLGRELVGATRDQRAFLRANMQMVFQDPYSSLDPSMTVLDIVAEPVDARSRLSKAERSAMVGDALRLVGLDPAFRHRYPSEFSGGQRQRIAIARAIMLRPPFVVCDEAVSALDVSTKSHIVAFLKRIQQETGTSYLFISHDLAVVRNISARIAVIYAGQICEIGPARRICARPAHPYTQALISANAVPDPRANRRHRRIVLKGDPANAANPPSGCPFHPRCNFAMDICRTVSPELTPLDEGGAVACHLHAAASEAADGSSQFILEGRQSRALGSAPVETGGLTSD
jgi:oligopeptide/dipeptide ABC transporter ATP-binding protein